MIYVMSDIHGNMRRFHSVMEQINLQPEDTLYILGDVIDRHPDGIRILRKIMDNRLVLDSDITDQELAELTVEDIREALEEL